MNRKVIFIDVDDTLLTKDKTISPKTLQVIKDVQALGHKIVPCTGANFFTHQPRLIDTNLEYVIASNGAHIRSLKDGTVLHRDEIPTELARKVIDAAMPHCDEFSFHADSKQRLSTLQEPLEDFLANNKLTQIVPWGRTRETAQELLQVMKDFCKQNNLEIANYAKAIDNPKFLEECGGAEGEFFGMDIVNSGVNKGNGVRRFCEIMNIDLADTVSVGDGHNDLAMFDVTAINVAMGNATDELKNAADFVVSDNNNDGVAQAFIKLGLLTS